MAASVEYLEKIKELQDINYESERKRLDLENELNTYAKSDSRMARLKAIRLQNYWKKICEDEKRSQWRNEQLLQDFDRVERHMEELSTRTERLKVMKKQYEEYIERMYPGWKEKVIFMAQQRSEAEKRAQTSPVNVGENMMHVPPPGINIENMAKYQWGISSVSSGLSPSQASFPQNQQHMQRQVPQEVPKDNLQYVRDISRRAQLATEERIQDITKDSLKVKKEFAGQRRGMSTGDYPMSPGEIIREYDHINVDVIPSAGSTLQTISSLPTGTSLTSTQAHMMAANMTGNMSITQESDVSDFMNREQVNHTATIPYEDVQPAVSSRAIPEENSIGESIESPKQATIKPVPKGVVHVPSSYDERDIQSPVSDHRSSGRNTPVGFLDETSARSPSRTSTPLDSGRRHSGPNGPRSRQNSQSSILEDKSEDKSIYPEADVTLDGLYNLLDAVQRAFELTRQSKEFYRTQLPPPSVRNEIIENCNKGQMLSYMDPTSVSMVALEQLPMVVYNSEGGALLSDNYLGRNYTDPSYEEIRGQIHPASAGFWDRLCQHFVALIKFSIMTAEDVGEIFGPNLIAEDSPYDDKAKVLLVSMLDGIEAGDPVSPGSTATLSSMPTPRDILSRPVPNEDVPPLDLPSQSEKSDDKLAQTGGLTQTAAYRQILGSTASSQRMDFSDDSDEDDIEKMLTKSITSPRTVSTTPKTQVSVTPKAPQNGTSNTDPRKQSAGSGVSSDEDSHVMSPKSPAAYVPTGLTGTGKSTMSFSSGKSSKNPAFRYGDSDTDEDVDLMGTGKSSTLKHGGEQDDFDFYG